MTRIALSGYPGSGTTTLAHHLAAELPGAPIISTGAVFRQMAQDHGLSLEAFGALVDRTPQIDRDLDARTIAEIEATPSCIAEGRLVAALCPDADLRVWLHAPLDTRARRVFGRSGETRDAMERREIHEYDRYLMTYDIDLANLEQYDLVFNTAKFKPAMMASVILAYLRWGR